MHLKPILHSFFFGNYFYGICAVALSIEATLQQRVPLNGVLYYVLIFLLTVIYYTKAYVSDTPAERHDPRTSWYVKNSREIYYSQVGFVMLSLVILIIMTIQNAGAIRHITALQITLITLFPAIAGFYYGIENRFIPGFNLRNIGWMKPFVIGFVWAGFVTVYPIIYYAVVHRQVYQPDLIGSLLFLKNFMYITVLCIMFDIKDYATDSNQELKTFVVRAGLRATIFRIIIPLCILGLGSFLIFAIVREFSFFKILLNCIPFVLMVMLAYSLQRRRSILFYLVLIDGLMLVKAICGSIAVMYF
jgi:Ca2+/Na+ antiporter